MDESRKSDTVLCRTADDCNQSAVCDVILTFPFFRANLRKAKNKANTKKKRVRLLELYREISSRFEEYVVSKRRSVLRGNGERQMEDGFGVAELNR